MHQSAIHVFDAALLTRNLSMAFESTPQTPGQSAHTYFSTYEPSGSRVVTSAYVRLEEGP